MKVVNAIRSNTRLTNQAFLELLARYCGPIGLRAGVGEGARGRRRWLGPDRATACCTEKRLSY